MGETRRNAAQKYVILLGNVPIEVTRKAVKNVNFRIKADGSVHMTVPWRVPRQAAQEEAERHRRWIESHRAAVLARGRRAQRPQHLWRTGEVVHLWGKEVGLEVGPSPKAEAELRGAVLCLGVPERHMGDDAESVEWRGKLVDAFLAGQLRERLEQILPEREARVGLRASSVTIRRMKTRWGSCTPRTGRIRLNTALAEKPPDYLDMVLVHELCHLREANHGPRFYALMDEFYPGWAEVNAAMKRDGPSAPFAE